MTTIATDGKSMAGDGQADIANTITVTNRRKVYRTDEGVLIGCAGRAVDSQRFRAWFADRSGKLRVERFAALVLYPTGKLEYWNEDLEPVEMSPPCAVGSGMDYALGAMEAGADPVRAVEIASKRDPHTGGDIIVEHLT